MLMPGWRNVLLRDFEEPIQPLSLVSDPDGFLHDPKINKVLEEKGIEVLEYGDPIAFRYVYESRFREDLLTNSARLIVRVRGSLDSLPSDLLQIGRRLEYYFASIFPKLSSSVVRELSPQEIDVLYTQYSNYAGTTSRADTCDFILQRVYRLAYNLIDTKTEFIKTLLAFHQSGKTLPPTLQDHLVATLEKRPLLSTLPIRELLTSEGAFYQYLGEEWLGFLSGQSKPGTKISEPRGSFGINENHPFEDVAVQALLGSAFVAGKIPKVTGFETSRLPKWTRVGLRIDENRAIKEQFNALLGQIEGYVVADWNYRQVQQLAALIGEANSLRLSSSSVFDDDSQETWVRLTQRIDEQFQDWLGNHFSSLISLPYSPRPVMVNHIPHYLGSLHKEKTALIVLDGMNFAQWVQIRAYLQDIGKLSTEEDAVFAWVPTITSVSRQAIFSGELPFAFSDSIQSTNKEEQAWKLFWENRGIFRNYIVYRRGLGDGSYDASQSPTNSTVIAGYVVDTIDQLVHKALQGQRSVHAELKLWLENNYLLNLIQDLLSKGFSVYLASDHGNCESVGVGRPNEGVLAHTKGERVRIYKDKNIRNKFLADYQGIAWDGHGLPPDMFLLLAQAGQAFTNKGKLVVSHGGISLEEVVVPFVHIK